MFSNNPFVAVAASLPPHFMQAFIVVMVVAVIAGTLFDVVHKGSARYFFDNWRRAKAKGGKTLASGELASIALQTVAVDVLASGEFCGTRRRIAHLLGMYGFVLYVLATAVMVFDPAASAHWAQLWWVGGLMICVGGYWFWFFIRVDVAAEGNSRFRVVQADLFILSLLASTTLGLLWAAAGGGVGALFFLYLVATAVLFFGVPWSKFAHMFFKPAAAFEKRVSNADGTRSNLPAPADAPEAFSRARERPQHY
ncbi:MAG: hypothetical protein ACREVQ_06925 [Burkholderiales bacterium]